MKEEKRQAEWVRDMVGEWMEMGWVCDGGG